MADGKEIYSPLRQCAVDILRAALEAVDPGKCVRRSMQIRNGLLHIGDKNFHLEEFERILVIGAGKAAGPMAAATEDVLGAYLSGGVVVTKYNHGLPLRSIRILEAGHPIPDENSQAAAEEILNFISGAEEKTLIICLISGGGSTLLSMPVAGVDITAKQQMSRLLLESGATINEINTVRKHLSRIKGGNLCTYTGKAQLVSLILSDVIGDDLQVIASGLTAPDSTTFSDCFQIFDQYHLWEALPVQVADHFTRASVGKVAETPKPGAPAFQRVFNLIIGSNSLALQAAADAATERGFSPLVLTSMLKGEAKEVGLVLTSIAKEIQRSGSPITSPACLLSGGETTVTLVGKGLGGRNMELALAASLELDQTEGIMLLSAGTDGTDGPTDSAGAFADGTTAGRAKSKGLNPRISLKNNDSYNFFKEVGDLLCTGPTRTNVMDLQIFLIAPCQLKAHD